MNAGAYGGEMRDVLESAELALPDGTVAEAPAEELELTYRHSALEGSGRVLTGAVFRLRPDSGAEIAARMRALAEKRRASQPLEWPSAGGATYADVTALIAEVQRRVFERFGVMLEPEVRILGPEG